MIMLVLKAVILSIWLQEISCFIEGGLQLSEFIRNGSAFKGRELSTVNPEAFAGVHSHSGFITVKDEYNSTLFFWYFPVAEEVESTPWIIWLSGGPGVTSLMYLFEMIGPVKLDDHGKVVRRNVSWADYSLLFIDNPVGAGFSYTEDIRGYTSSEDEVGAQLYSFLEQFIQLFPELRTAPLYLAGSSYAGKYVPAIGLEIHRNMDSLPLKLKGLSMGNALIDPRSIMHYSSIMRELGFLEDKQIINLIELEQSVLKLIDENKMIDASNKYNETIEYIKEQTGVSIYNYMRDPTPIPGDFEKFVNRQDIRDHIHVGNATFDLDNQLVYEKMLPDIMNSTKPRVEELLEHYGVMCYNGQQDMFIPFSLTKRMLDTFQWSGRDEFINAPRKRLRHKIDNRVVAYRKTGGNLMEVMIRGAGHMVPMDQPEVAKCIIEGFINHFK